MYKFVILMNYRSAAPGSSTPGGQPSYLRGQSMTPNAVPSIHSTSLNDSLPVPSVGSPASAAPSPLPNPHSQPASIPPADPTMPTLSPHPPASNSQPNQPSTPMEAHDKSTPAATPEVPNPKSVSSATQAFSPYPNCNSVDHKTLPTNENVSLQPVNNPQPCPTNSFPLLKRPILAWKEYETLVVEDEHQPSEFLYDYSTMDAWYVLLIIRKIKTLRWHKSYLTDTNFHSGSIIRWKSLNRMQKNLVRSTSTVIYTQHISRIAHPLHRPKQSRFRLSRNLTPRQLKLAIPARVWCQSLVLRDPIRMSSMTIWPVQTYVKNFKHLVVQLLSNYFWFVVSAFRTKTGNSETEQTGRRNALLVICSQARDWPRPTGTSTRFLTTRTIRPATNPFRCQLHLTPISLLDLWKIILKPFWWNLLEEAEELLTPVYSDPKNYAKCFQHHPRWSTIQLPPPPVT